MGENWLPSSKSHVNMSVISCYVNLNELVEYTCPNAALVKPNR